MKNILKVGNNKRLNKTKQKKKSILIMKKQKEIYYLEVKFKKKDQNNFRNKIYFRYQN